MTRANRRPSRHHTSPRLRVYASRLRSLLPGAGYRPENEDEDPTPSPAISAVMSAEHHPAPARPRLAASIGVSAPPSLAHLQLAHATRGSIAHVRPGLLRVQAPSGRNPAYTIATGASTPSPRPHLPTHRTARPKCAPIAGVQSRIRTHKSRPLRRNTIATSAS
ncbi:hypothetical protein K438DRAFT_1960116 [Mycena galopus ATCC 62051]|nr:hypothetical protein K438DRAFT_1960116 [Mycena galopus ATCC 62051]